MNLAEIGQRFLNGDPIDGVRYRHNDFVFITSGANSGGSGSLVTITSFDPEPKYLVELESGIDVEVLQSCLTCRAG